METLKILYVEDDQRAAGEVQELAARRGDIVVWENSGSGGLLRAGMEKFDVIILDRMLGDLDGLTILKRARKRGRDAGPDALGAWPHDRPRRRA